MFIRIVVFTCFALFFLPLIILGENSYFTVWDVLDSDFIYPVLLKMSGQWLNFSADAVIPNVFNGIPRSAFRTGLSLTVTLFQVFPPHVAYIINYIIVHSVAFAGMYLLLRHHFLANTKEITLCLSIALIYACIPFYSIYGISFGGQPLLLFCFLNILRNRDKWYDWLCISLFPFYSNFALTYPFYFTVLAALFAADGFMKRKLNLRFLIAVVLLGAIYCLADFQMLKALFIDKQFIPHRIEFNRELVKSITFWESVKKCIKLLFHSHFHSGAMWTFPVIIASAFVYFRNRINKSLFHLLLPVILLILILYGFYDQLAVALGPMVPLLTMFQFDRMYIILPCIWMILLAVSLKKIKEDFPSNQGIYLTGLLLVVQLSLVLAENSQFMNNVKLLAGKKIQEPAYKEFFATDLFEQVDRFIDKPKNDYRVVCIGMHSSVALMNGFFTLDGYFDLYPLEYKHKFRKIISKELDKNKWIRKNFDGWGNRVYIMPAELEMNFLCGKNDTLKIRNLELDLETLKQMGGKFIFSAVEIDISRIPGLRLEAMFSHPDAYWDIYLYAVI
ncbi:MAG: hypothetical protein HYY40_14200 [Bacteroidetes bacterium]|nr:hypothetical protein [Bacteroidota bacterium]